MRKACLNSVYDLAKKDKRVLFIGTDLGPGVLDSFKKDFPDRFLMEGVTEQHTLGMSAGLAMDGYIPYLNNIATFLTRRSFEQMVIDVCLHNLPVRLIGNGGGLVYAPLGPTHTAIEDIAILRALPNITILAPCDAEEMKELMHQTLNWPYPIYIRLAKGGDKIVSDKKNNIKIGKAILFHQPKDVLFISTGIMTQVSLDASEKLKQDGIEAGILHMHTIKPLDKESLLAFLPKAKIIITVEEHLLNGGLGSSILEFASDNLPKELYKIKRIGIPDQFVQQYGNQNSLMNYYGLSIDNLCAVAKKKIMEV